MEHEFGQSRSQLKGYLFEVFIMELLCSNQFSIINILDEPKDRVRENRKGFIEIKGRGCWHQIDCPCDYNKLIPFAYPLRVLGEVKFFKSELSKVHIREYIGIIKDIQENYFVGDEDDIFDFYPRKMEIGVYFSANGFQKEAEKLAYAHGIKTISYKNNFIINKLKFLIEELESNYLSVKILRENKWKGFKEELIKTLRYNDNFSYEYDLYLSYGYRRIIDEIKQMFITIKSSFIATTATGVFIHFVGDSDFPHRLFQESDEGRCRVFFNIDDWGNRFFWIEISGDDLRRRFYFTPPESLDYASVFGKETALNEKERLFHTLIININLNGISRIILLHLDQDWLDVIRDENNMLNY